MALIAHFSAKPWKTQFKTKIACPREVDFLPPPTKFFLAKLSLGSAVGETANSPTPWNPKNFGGGRGKREEREKMVIFRSKIHNWAKILINFQKKTENSYFFSGDFFALRNLPWGMIPPPKNFFWLRPGVIPGSWDFIPALKMENRSFSLKLLISAILAKNNQRKIKKKEFWVTIFFWLFSDPLPKKFFWLGLWYSWRFYPRACPHTRGI